MSIKHRTMEILEVVHHGDRASRAFEIFIVTLIVVNVVAVILATVDSVAQHHRVLLRWIEVISITVFTAEYALRIWSSTSIPRYKDPITGRLRFALTPHLLIDLLAVLPFYLPMLIPVDLRFVRAVRLTRIFRVLKLGRYSDSLKVIGAVFKARKEALLNTVFITALILALSSSLVYYAEHRVQPDKFSSIPAAMWWGVQTLCTVGYGDLYPITPLGKVMGSIVALLGIGLFALPTAILGSGFIEEVGKRKRVLVITCPHCGKEIERGP